MVERGLVLRFWALGGLLLPIAAGCAGTPENETPPPDIELISVFYPVDGLVRGLGLAGAVSTKVDRVAVRAHPTSTESCSPINEDGSFEFTVVAVDNDVLELTGAFGAGCEDRGAPAFVRVPVSPLPPVDFVCCGAAPGSEGTCQSIQKAENNEPCPDGQTGVKQCSFDAECGTLEGEILTLLPNQVEVGAPDESGNVVVEGVVPDYPNALVRIENLGFSPLGIGGTRTRRATITNDTGRFRFGSLRASGDEELAVQVQDLNGFRSPPIGKRVPDAELGGLDIIGVYAYEDLEGDTRGPIAVHIAPYGIDGRGMCPDGGNAVDWICYTGGITHSMVNIVDAQVVSSNVAPNLLPSPTSSVSQTRQYNTGVVGDVRSSPQEIVVVLDLSEAAAPTVTERQIQIEEVKQFIDRIRSRDRVAAVVMTNFNEGSVVAGGLKTFDRRNEIKAGLDTYIGPDPTPKTTSGSLQGLVMASKVLRDNGSINGKIVMLVGTPPTAETETADDKQGAFQQRTKDAFDGVLGPFGSTVPVFETHILGLDLVPGLGDFSILESIVDFSEGQYWATTSNDPSDLEQTLTDLLQELSGAFILLYDINVPCVGKSMTLDLTLELAVGDQRASSQYRGPIRIQRGCQN